MNFAPHYQPGERAASAPPAAPRDDDAPSWEAIAMLIVGRAMLRANCPTFARWVLRAWFEVIAFRGRLKRRRAQHTTTQEPTA